MTASYVPQGEHRRKASTLASSLSPAMLGRAARDAVVKLDPRKLTGNPVIFATWIVALLASASTVAEIMAGHDWGFEIQIALWLWATVLFANLAESVAEGRGKAAAYVFGISFDNWFAWWLWRTVYLMKLVGWGNRVRVVVDWTLDLFHPRDMSRI